MDSRKRTTAPARPVAFLYEAAAVPARRLPSSIREWGIMVRRCWRSRTAASSPASPSGRCVAGQGDLVVNTSQTGYQEIATDPAYAGQLVVMTYPLIGNYGRIHHDDQSERPWLRGLIVANATAAVLDDARQLATMLRESRHPGDRRRGHASPRAPPPIEREPARRPDGAGRDGRRRGSRAGPRACLDGRTRTSWPRCRPVEPRDEGDPSEGGPLVAIIDFGLKTNIVRSLRQRGARVRILPHTATAAEALAPDVDGVVFSPGPGDPAPARRPRGPGPRRHRATVGRCWASAWATRSSAGRRAPARGACRSDTTPRIIRCRTSRRAWSRSRPRTTRSRSSRTRCRRRAASWSARST